MNLFFLNPILVGAMFGANLLSSSVQQSYFTIADVQPQFIQASVLPNKISHFSATQTTNGVQVQSDTLTMVRCELKEPLPIFKEQYAEYIHSFRMWMYELDGTSAHRFFVSNAEMAQNQKYDSLPRFSQLEGSNTYLIMSEKDLYFDCDSGLQLLPECGNGIIEHVEIANANEQCDDGNLLNGDGCDMECQISDAKPYASTTDLMRVESTHPLKDGSPIIPGKQMLSQFTFTFQEPDKKQALSDIIFTITAHNTALLAYTNSGIGGFEIYNSKNPDARMPCSATMINGTPMVAREFTGKALIICDALDYSDVNSSVSTGGTVSLSLDGYILSPNIQKGNPSFLGVSLDHIDNSNAESFGPQESHVLWYSDQSTKEYVRWIDMESPIVYSTEFRM